MFVFAFFVSLVIRFCLFFVCFVCFVVEILLGLRIFLDYFSVL